MSPLPEESDTGWQTIGQRLIALEEATRQRQASNTALMEKLARRAEALRRRPREDVGRGNLHNFLSFSRGQERYGISLDHVLEVQRLEQYSPVPGAPEFVRGVVHYRGSILSLVDLGR